jgi:hypothetical protein
MCRRTLSKIPLSTLALALLFPGVDEGEDVPSLRLGESHLQDEPARLRGVVVLDGSLEVLAERDGLAELPAEPAEQADPCRRDRH